MHGYVGHGRFVSVSMLTFDLLRDLPFLRAILRRLEGKGADGRVCLVDLRIW